MLLLLPRVNDLPYRGIPMIILLAGAPWLTQCFIAQSYGGGGGVNHYNVQYRGLDFGAGPMLYFLVLGSSARRRDAGPLL